MTVEKTKPKQWLWPITTGADSAMNQSSVTHPKGGKNHAYMVRLVLVLILIGWKTGENLLSQSLSAAIAITLLLSTVIWKLLYWTHIFWSIHSLRKIRKSAKSLKSFLKRFFTITAQSEHHRHPSILFPRIFHSWWPLFSPLSLSLSPPTRTARKSLLAGYLLVLIYSKLHSK